MANDAKNIIAALAAIPTPQITEVVAALRQMSSAAESLAGELDAVSDEGALYNGGSCDMVIQHAGKINAAAITLGAWALRFEERMTRSLLKHRN